MEFYGNIVRYTDSLNFKAKLNNGRIDNVDITVPLKHLSNFRRTFEML